MQWEAIATGGAALVALIFAWWQLSEMKRERRAKLALPLFEEMRSPEARQSVRKITEIYKQNRKKLDEAMCAISEVYRNNQQKPDIIIPRASYECLTMPRQAGDVGDIVNKIDLLGLLVAKGLVEKDIAMAVTRTSALRVWYILALCTDYIQHRRLERGHHAIFAEDYARRCLLYEINRVHKDEQTKLERNNLVEILCYMHGVTEQSKRCKVTKELKKQFNKQNSMLNEYSTHFRERCIFLRCTHWVKKAFSDLLCGCCPC